jgi:CBS domain-containing protein
MDIQTRDPIVIYEDIPESEVISMLKEVNNKHRPLVVIFSVIVLIALLFIGVRLGVRLLKLMS